MQRMGALLSLFCVALTLHAQMHEPIKCETSWEVVSDGVAELRIAATIDAGWHLYSTELEDGPTAATLVVETIEGARLDGKLGFEGKEIAKYDDMFGMDVRYFEDKVTFVQRFAIESDDYAVQGYFQYGACDDQSCLPPTNVEFKYGAAQAAAVQAATGSSQSSSPFGALWEPVIDELGQPAGTADTATQSLWVIFLLGLAGGLVALVTPCVWPIIPMTVSFFLKRSGDKKKGRRDAYIYGISIVVIYVLLGLVVTLVFGASALNALSTAAVPNLFFFLLLVVFAMSFMGAFELTLPEKWTTAVDGKAEKTGGLLGIFLMAFTLTLVSFSCTGPIIGFLLVEVSTSGNILGPTVGMLGFAIALALPFTLFAIFPAWLKSAPKSGGWMNTVKVVLAFVELAFALKFLSVADLAYGWHILDRETFLALWIALFALLGAYLMKWIQFPHDDDDDRKIAVPRFMLGLITFAFAIYMVPGLWGAPLKAISAFSPPMSTQDFNLYEQELHPQAMDYDQGMAIARQEGKPVMLDFSGYGCVNCREMEQSVLADEKVMNIINNDYVLVTLYVDDKTPLAEPIHVMENGKEVTLRSVGDKWSYLQRSKFGANAQPFYVLLDNAGHPLTTSRSYDEDIEAYIKFLEEGLVEYAGR
ncbi:MAG: thioredoxin family protein [Bacteroidaceae bacterium]|nr:thioredoxin family protein [Bacteroidaceae bacterium]